MPGERNPEKNRETGPARVRQGGWKDRFRKRLAASAAIPLTALASTPALAQQADAAGTPLLSFTSTEIVLLAVFGGAMSFAILSATWLIRERGRMVGENNSLRRRLADLRTANDRLEALASSGDQRIVVWNGAEEKPVVMGRLSKASGAPEDRGDFLAFGRWMAPDSAIGFEGALKRLRTNAESFDLPILTRGGVLEAQGRTSGSHAFVRFVELTGERSALARLEADHATLLATFDSIQALFERLPVPVWLRDRMGEMLWVNSAYARAVDCASGEEAIERRLNLLDSAERKEVGRRQRESGYFSGAMPAVVSGDRKMLDITEVSTQAGSAGIAMDRSEIEAVRATLKQTQQTHAQTLDHLATGVAMFDGQQRLQFHNSSLQKLFDLPAAFLASQPTNAQVLDAMRAERKLPELADWRKWREQQLEIYKALEAREEYWHLPDGRTLRVVVNPHSQGGATWLFDNVTEQLELRTNYNSLMRTQGETLENLSEAVAVFGSDGRLKLFNPAFLNIWGLEAGICTTGMHIAQIGKRIGARLADERDWQTIAEAITGFDDERGDKAGRLDAKDGKIIDFALVRLPEGQTMLALVDVTATVSVERALKERNEALEQADRLKNRFLQHVSYELRAPLTSISGFAELLDSGMTGTLEGAQGEYVGYILSSAQVLKTIIDDILDLATIDAGAMTLDLEPVPVSEVAQECLEEAAATTSARGIRSAVSVAPGCEHILADRRRLRQIIDNLVSNAIAFSPDGGRIGVTATPGEGCIELSVTDEGPGVPEDYRESLFERFEGRGSGERRRGAGLGLSIVRSFMELHGGSVHVEQAEGRGARFVCRFPHEQRQARKAA